MISQSHFTLSFPLKAPADARALAEQLPPMMPGFFENTFKSLLTSQQEQTERRSASTRRIRAWGFRIFTP